MLLRADDERDSGPGEQPRCMAASSAAPHDVGQNQSRLFDSENPIAVWVNR